MASLPMFVKTLHATSLPPMNYICAISMKPAKNNLSLINFTTGVSDGLILPFAFCLITSPHFLHTPWKLFGVGIIVAFAGALVFGLARFFGEREEIKHNHPLMAADEAKKEVALMNTIGIDKELSLEMELQMEQERALWLKEVQENDMGWERYDNKRAIKSGLQTGLGFLSGGALVCLPFAFMQDEVMGLVIPSILYLLLLFVFGWLKGKLIHTNPLRSAIDKSSKGFVVLILVFVLLYFSGFLFKE
jgi:VIT1/CCC1 family predicted Fe2+/Mn2+ transporter